MKLFRSMANQNPSQKTSSNQENSPDPWRLVEVASISWKWKFTAMITLLFHLQPQYNTNFIYISHHFTAREDMKLTNWPGSISGPMTIHAIGATRTDRNFQHSALPHSGFYSRFLIFQRVDKIYQLKVKSDHRSQFSNLSNWPEGRSLKNIRDSTGFEPVTSPISVRCSTNWAVKPHIRS